MQEKDKRSVIIGTIPSLSIVNSILIIICLYFKETSSSQLIPKSSINHILLGVSIAFLAIYVTGLVLLIMEIVTQESGSVIFLSIGAYSTAIIATILVMINKLMLLAILLYLIALILNIDVFIKCVLKDDGLQSDINLSDDIDVIKTMFSSGTAQIQPAYKADYSTKSYFDGSGIELLGINIIVSLAIIFTFGIATPFVIAYKERWTARHTYINGRRLAFDGSGFELLGYWILWSFLNFITLGLFAIYIYYGYRSWIFKHTYFEDEGNTNGSSLNASFWEFLGVGIIGSIICFFTCFLGFPWANAMLEKHFAENREINTRKLCYDGKGIEMLGVFLLNGILTLITCGIYTPWAEKNIIAYNVEHTHFAIYNKNRTIPASRPTPNGPKAVMTPAPKKNNIPETINKNNKSKEQSKEEKRLNAAMRFFKIESLDDVNLDKFQVFFSKKYREKCERYGRDSHEAKKMMIYFRAIKEGIEDGIGIPEESLDDDDLYIPESSFVERNVSRIQTNNIDETYERKSMPKWIIFATISALALIAAIVLFFVFLNPFKGYDISKNIQIEFVGENGSGYAVVNSSNVDEYIKENIKHPYNKALKTEKDQEAMLQEASDIPEIYSIEVYPMNGLYDGDKVTVMIDYDNKLAKKYKLKFSGANSIELTVEGLSSGAGVSYEEDIPTGTELLDAFDPEIFDVPEGEPGISIVTKGIIPNATISLVNNIPDKDSRSSIEYTLDHTDIHDIEDIVTIFAEPTTAGYELYEYEYDYKCDKIPHYIMDINELDEHALKRIQSDCKDIIDARITPVQKRPEIKYKGNKYRIYPEINSAAWEKFDFTEEDYDYDQRFEFENAYILHPKEGKWAKHKNIIKLQFSVDSKKVSDYSSSNIYPGGTVYGYMYITDVYMNADGKCEYVLGSMELNDTLYDDYDEFLIETINKYKEDYLVEICDIDDWNERPESPDTEESEEVENESENADNSEEAEEQDAV